MKYKINPETVSYGGGGEYDGGEYTSGKEKLNIFQNF